MAALVSWWQGLSARERVLMSVAGMLAAAVVGSLGIVRPLVSALDGAAAAHGAALDREAAVAWRVATLRNGAGNGRGNGAAPARSVTAAQIVEQIAGEMGVPVTRNDASGADGASIATAPIRAGAVMALLDTLDDAGLTIATAQLARTPDGTVTLAATVRRRS